MLSCGQYRQIPTQYFKPLNVQTEIEYTFDEEKFPGLETTESEPALVVATDSSPQDNTVSSSHDLSSGQKSNHPSELTIFSQKQDGLNDHRHEPTPLLNSGDPAQATGYQQQLQKQQQQFLNHLFQLQRDSPERFQDLSGVQRRLSYGANTSGHSLADTNSSFGTSPPSAKHPPLPRDGFPAAGLSCLDPFDDSLSQLRNDGTFSGVSTPVNRAPTPEFPAGSTPQLNVISRHHLPQSVLLGSNQNEAAGIQKDRFSQKIHVNQQFNHHVQLQNSSNVHGNECSRRIGHQVQSGNVTTSGNGREKNCNNYNNNFHAANHPKDPQGLSTTSSFLPPCHPPMNRANPNPTLERNSTIALQNERRHPGMSRKRPLEDTHEERLAKRPFHGRTYRREHVEVYGVETLSNNSTPAARNRGAQPVTGVYSLLRVPQSHTSPVIEESDNKGFDEYSCLPKRPNDTNIRSTVHHYGAAPPSVNASVSRRPANTYRANATRKTPDAPPPNVVISNNQLVGYRRSQPMVDKNILPQGYSTGPSLPGQNVHVPETQGNPQCQSINSQFTSCPSQEIPMNPCVTNDTFLDILYAN